ncbi:MAG: class II glutamine amidotransferase [Proteobacteria bacterium]|nr:class II glutamine amidotransferase [Pseudomonadota bacterium]
MCRFVLYQGPSISIADLVTRPVHSIIRQSFKAEELAEPLNGDGFGVAWYVTETSEKPAVFRDITPAWNNENLRHLARVTRSGTILAHVRAATPGLTVTQTNCHPFVHGRYAFMHNGNLAGFMKARQKLLSLLSEAAFAAIRGTSDSEHIFGLFLDRLAERKEDKPVERMANALEATLRQLAEIVPRGDEPSTLNLAVTDGSNTVVSRCIFGDLARATTLYMREGQRFRCKNGLCVMDAVSEGGTECPTCNEASAVLIASEPLFEHETWSPVDPQHLVLVDANRQVTRRPLWLAR